MNKFIVLLMVCGAFWLGMQTSLEELVTDGATAVGVTTAQAEEDGFDLLGEIDESELVELPPEKPKWMTVGGPIALALFLVFLLWLNYFTVPFRVSEESLLLYYYPTGVKRGLALAVALYGVAFLFGSLEIVYQLHFHGSTEAYFANMSLGKLIAFTHAHLFGFITSFLIVGIPFSMQFNHLSYYQWFLPVGLAAAVTDVISWWGIKYVSANFEHISMLCGILFACSYLYMLIALLRVLLFPHVILFSDKDADERRVKLRDARLEREARDLHADVDQSD